MTQDCPQKQMTDEDIGPILKAKEKVATRIGKLSAWFQSAEGLLGTMGIPCLREQIAEKGFEKLQMDETWSCS